MKLVRKNYFVLVILLLLFATPGIFAYFFFTHPDKLGVTATTNKGDLLQPPIFLAQIQQSKKIMKALDFSSERKWHLILWSPQACETSCFKHLDQLMRIRLALGRQLYNVIPQLVLSADAPDISAQVLTTLKDQGVEVVRLAKNESKQLSKDLSIYIANPDNFLVLVYPSSVKPDDIFQDMKHLLTTTQKIGK